MPQTLLICVRLHEGRYHGMGEWPPSPARLFQAILAGAALSGPLDEEERRALEWLEQLDPPVIGAPKKRDGHRFTLYVPNNDLDTVGGDPRRIAEIRGAEKNIEPKLFDAGTPFIYAWTFKEHGENQRCADTMCALAKRLYQFGRGVDFAWAWGQLLDDRGWDVALSTHAGNVYRPSNSGSGSSLGCPERGSLVSLETRHAASRQRFSAERKGKTVSVQFSKPPKPRFQLVAYESRALRAVYELRSAAGDGSIAVWPLCRVYRLVMQVRGERLQGVWTGAVGKLVTALPGKASEIERALIGRKADGSNDISSHCRVRIVPLPSIGHPYADRGIRRIAVEVPADSPLRAEDVQWAFSGLELVDAETGEALARLTGANNGDKMLGHYGVDANAGYLRWRSVTPVALPEVARRGGGRKNGRDRIDENLRAASGIVKALRHAAIRTRPAEIWVQREPFEGRGEPAEAFAAGTRFAGARLWHVEISFAEPVNGPMVIGDGRFLGLGIMAPATKL